MSLTHILTGKQLRLAALVPQDAETIAGWYLNEDFSRSFMGSADIVQTPDSLRESFQEMQKSRNEYAFGVRTLTDDTLVGLTEIDHIIWHHRVCGIAIGISPDHHGKGYGTEAISLLLNFCFYEINMYRVQLSVFEYNTSAIGLYEKVGFTREGVSRKMIERNGQRYDDIKYGMLRDEWQWNFGKRN